MSFPTRPRFLSNFYPRPPRGGRHIPLAALNLSHRFLSTPSARRATGAVEDARGPQQISIHALREEGDRAIIGPATGIENFYPRPPRGGRPVRDYLSYDERRFLSTPSARRATLGLDNYLSKPKISIHALREEGD